MDTDLLTVARTLAERGWLPGIAYLGENSGFWYSSGKPLDNHAAVEADLHLAAHNEIVRREAGYRIADNVTMFFPTLYRDIVEPGNDTLALLRCLMAACEASESKEDA